jgi:prepilin signal peptidase PulO-like enzyme (type II secretory pathway)
VDRSRAAASRSHAREVNELPWVVAANPGISDTCGCSDTWTACSASSVAAAATGRPWRAAAADQDSKPRSAPTRPALSVVGSLAAGLTLLVCWRFAGAGFGDVRLAMLGGLGLGHATHSGLLLGLVAVVAMTVTQAGVAVARGGNRQTMIPFGPALAAGCLLAAAL